MGLTGFARKLTRSAKKRLGITIPAKVAIAPPILASEPTAEPVPEPALEPVEEIDAEPVEDPAMAFIDRLPSVLQYRKAYFEMRGHVAPGAALPTARAWPQPDGGLSYRDKLTGLLDLKGGRGAEIGPLNIPLIPKEGNRVLYVDHLDTAALHEKYAGVEGIVEIDRPMANDNLADTLRADAPLDYLCGSQVFEHVPNPIRWLKEIADVMRTGGLLALSIPDRRMTFDLFREESSAADMVAAYYDDAKAPDVRAVFDNQLLAAAVNMNWIYKDSLTPEEIFASRGALSPRVITLKLLAVTDRARRGEYLDSHCWVFTPPGFLIVMSQLADSGFLPFKCHQFYPTNDSTPDRGNSSFTVVLEKVPDGTDNSEIRRSFLMALGD